MHPSSSASRRPTPRRRTPRARALAAASLAALGAACASEPDRARRAAADTSSAPATRQARRDTAVVREAFGTPHDTTDNVDSPTVWHGRDGTHWLLATAKTSDAVLVNDAATGAPVRRLGGPGDGPGRLSRPNGILALDSLLLVVERDNHRVQAFRLPSLAPLGTFGDSVLRKPYGIAARSAAPGTLAVYVTDSYETADGQVPPLGALGARVREFAVRDAGGDRMGAVRGALVRTFGDTTARGALRIVESIAVDVPNARLLVAEELETDSHLKVYDLTGRYTGRDVGRGLFPQQAEGIALYACGDSAGYWVVADQGERTNTYHVLDRSTFAHHGAFTGARTRLTDGVALTQQAFGPFPAGAFYASHLDGSVSAFGWREIAAALGLRSDCGPPQRVAGARTVRARVTDSTAGREYLSGK